MHIDAKRILTMENLSHGRRFTNGVGSFYSNVVPMVRVFRRLDVNSRASIKTVYHRLPPSVRPLSTASLAYMQAFGLVKLFKRLQTNILGLHTCFRYFYMTQKITLPSFINERIIDMVK